MPTLPLGGHRYAMPPGTPLGLRGQADLLAAFLAHLDLRNVTLVANDWGGPILTAADHPDRIGALVLVATEAFDNVPPGLPGRVAAHSLRAGPLRRLPITLGWMAKHPLDDDLVRGWTEGIIRNAGVRADLRAYATASLEMTSAATTERCPTVGSDVRSHGQQAHAGACSRQYRQPGDAMTGSRNTFRLEVPERLAASHAKFFGEDGRAWITALPQLAAECLDRWALRRDGPPTYGAVALVLPVLLADGTPAVLKLQPIDEETAGEPIALGAWGGHGAVRLLRHDPDSGAMLLERLDADHSLAAVDDDLAALQTLSELVARLTAVRAPEGIRRLADMAAGMLDRARHALGLLDEPSERWLVGRCAGAVTELLPEAGDQLLHWDLHYDNVLRSRPGAQRTGGREPWLAIDPKPLAGDPGFELLPALHNRWDDVIASGNVTRAIRMRFDLMTEVLDLDRQRAAGWTLGRVLQNVLWEVENRDTSWHSEPDRTIAQVLLDRQ